MEILAIQLDSEWDNPGGNCARAGKMIREARPAKGALVVLPEMFASGFNMNVAAATREQDATARSLRDLAKELGIWMVAGIARSGSAANGRNCAVVIDPDGKERACYVKAHPFTLGGESEAYEAGSEIVTFDCGPFTVSPVVCYDLRFPELFRHAMLKGANVFVVIANWPISRVEHWMTLLRARAIENQSWVIGCNRTGRDPTTLYPGRSCVIDPMGVIRADAGDAEGVLRTEIDLEMVEQTRTKFRFLSDLNRDLLGWK